MVFGLSSSKTLPLHQRSSAIGAELSTESKIWKPGIDPQITQIFDIPEPLALRLLCFLRPGTRLFGHVAGAVERALHVIVFGRLAARRRS